MRYAIVIEKAGNNYSAYVPDLPGCVATGKTVQEVNQQIKQAIEFPNRRFTRGRFIYSRSNYFM